ncbi:MAG: hypothetical protein GXP55_01735, partial [Deltaproteobacteria bacterium]|nr:hypothetical protein [Deltaproteobacteria bacterium]
GLPAGVHAAPAAGNRPLFQERPPQATPPVERAANRYGIALDLGEGYGLEYASQQSQAMDSDGYALDGFDNAAVVGGGHLFFQHDVGEHLVFVTRLGFGYHARRAVSAWNLYSDPVFDLRIRAMKGHVMRFDLGETARVAFGRQGAWISSYIGLGGRVGVALFGYTGANLWQQAGSSDVYSTPASGTEVGYLAQATLEIGNYFGQKRTIEFGGSISVGKPLLSVNFHLGVSFNGW